ncbi:hypothetical protein AGDE_13360 [Angomonas deanei]|uniref:Thioredoxin domain-containing protein n=1 Tax=Angomonas deanei TaxID=59799 RepID=A0A7G2C573_9TRYP|nr:hypothetical protein AGDE_13360 [Angomonas deanei]CAD2214645.1 hypothetical protein, conserved [Angomonas deanei]|eukprot:EPY22395.1 hypothetical protein AGDE_13360 [Angomonas deanei]
MLSTDDVHSPVKRTRDDCSFSDSHDTPDTSSKRGTSEQGVSPDSVAEQENSLIFNPDAGRRKSEESLDVHNLTTNPKSPTTAKSMLHKSTRDPVVRGAITSLKSIADIEVMLAAARGELSDTHGMSETLRLAPGETVMFILYQSQNTLDEVVNAFTEELSGMRLFVLDLAALPAHEYTEWDSTPFQLSNSGSAHSLHKLAEEEEEEALLPPAQRPSDTPKRRTDVSFSQQLHKAGESLIRRLTDLLQVDSILNRHLRIDKKGNTVRGEEQAKRKDPMMLPAMVVWRAPSAPIEEYPPAAPETWTNTAASQPEAFNVRMSQYGGPLVVKNVQGVDAVHSLSLWKPVFTVEHLYRTLAATLRRAGSKKDTSRSVIYLGASWCPPCMNIVQHLPIMMKEDIPDNVQCMVKADMDLATPVFQFFGVEVIPVFMVLDNAVLFPDKQSLEAAEEVPLETVMKRIRSAEKERKQNSQRLDISKFIEKNCTGLRFDEDF